MNYERPDVQAGFRKGRGTRDQIAKICWIIKKAREFQKNIYFCSIDYAKAFGCEDHNQLWKILKEMGIPDHLTCLLRNLYAGKEATVKLDMEQQTGSKSEKEYVRAIYCHPAYLTSVQSTSCEILGWRITNWNQESWKKHQQPQICRWYHSSGRKWRETEDPLDEGERGEWKSWLETQH